MQRQVAVVGASGYTGAELVRLLSAHPGITVAAVTSEQSAGQAVEVLFPSLAGHAPQILRRLDPGAVAASAELVFLALPHQTAMAAAVPILDAGRRVVDLSADFRFRDPLVYESWYRTTHMAPALCPEAVYGLPEFHREALKTARLAAVPGCYPAGALLGLLPLLREGVIDPEGIVISAASGVSGAGRKVEVEYVFGEVSENFKAYGVAGHRHTPEIEQELSRAAGREVRVTFTPHLVPMTRGILSTCVVRLTRGVGTADLLALYRDAYKREPFIRVLTEGRLPETKTVRGSNYCDVAAKVDARTGRAIVLTAIDNLMKGASGQAIQCMNLMLDFEETAGLKAPALWP